MSVSTSLTEKVRTGADLPVPMAALLSAATPVTRIGMWARLLGPRVRVAAHVVSFGNITAGGTGKTPAVIERAELAINAGAKVGVITRGYHGELKGGPHVYDGSLPSWELARQFGDEPALIYRRVPGIVLVKSPDRVAGAERAVSEYKCDTLLLDDGFQYVRLERDENILLLDASNPFGNERLLPRGILREPLSAMKRATEILLTRCDQARDVEALVNRIRSICGHTPIRKTRHAPTHMWRVRDGEEHTLDLLHGADVAAVCAIGNPDAFYATVESLGARIVKRVTYSDHERFDPHAFSDHEVVVTTEKDAVRLNHPPSNLFALAIRLDDIA